MITRNIMAAQFNPQMMIDHANGQFLFDARRIYEARSEPNAPSPFPNNWVYDNLFPELQAMVDAHEPLGAQANILGNHQHRVILTPSYDISMFGGAPLTTVRRDGANGNSLRALAMAYKPTGISLVLNLPPDMSDAMYSFYGNSHLEINTVGNFPIYLNMFHPDVSSMTITSSHPGVITSLDPIVDRMLNNPDQSFRFIFEARGNNGNTTSIRPAPASSTRRTIRTLLMTSLNVMQTSPNPGLRIYLGFCLGNDPQRDDEDAHTYLQHLVGQTNLLNYSRVGRESRINKPAHLNIPQRSLRFGYDIVGGVQVNGCKRVTLSMH